MTAKRIWRRFADAVAAGLFAVLLADYILQVFMRYVVNNPLVWTLELSAILFIVVSLWAAAFCMDFKQHVGLDLVYELFGPQGKRIIATVSLGLFIGLGLYSIPDTIRLLPIMYEETTHALEFPVGHLFVLFLIFLGAYVVRAVLRVRNLYRNGWRDHL